MKNVRLHIELLGFWHAGSGHGRGGDADDLVIRDRDELPFLPGKTVKGLLRDACRLVKLHQKTGDPDRWFGRPDLRRRTGADSQVEPERVPGELTFTGASLRPDEAAWFQAASGPHRAALFQSISSTRITDAGVADDRTLRTIEIVPPLTLEATITGPDDEQWIQEIRAAAKLIRHLGAHRHRGLGRCRVTVKDIGEDTGDSTEPDSAPLDRTDQLFQWLEIELLSDAVFSAHGATTGGHETLDYIPGSTLLGAVAGGLFKKLGPAAADALLTGQIRFGDGLPLLANQLGWPVPGTFRVPKGADFSKGLTVINALCDTETEAEARVQRREVDQPLRGVAVTLGGGKFRPAGGFVLKSARDADAFGRAADAQLFGYATLRAGQKFHACLRWESSQTVNAQGILDQLTGGLVGLGRSRTAEFGMARVTRSAAPSLPREGDSGPVIPGSHAQFMTLYLASDLALEHQGCRCWTSRGRRKSSAFPRRRSSLRNAARSAPGATRLGTPSIVGAIGNDRCWPAAVS